MCDPFIIAAASMGVQTMARTREAGKINEAARRNEEGYRAQLAADQAALMLKRSVEAGEIARARHAFSGERERLQSKINVRFGAIYGTPRTSADRDAKNQAEDAFWAYEKAQSLSSEKQKAELSRGFLNYRAAVLSLPTVGSAELATGLGVYGVGTFAKAWETSELLKPPTDNPVTDVSLGGGMKDYSIGGEISNYYPNM